MSIKITLRSVSILNIFSPSFDSNCVLWKSILVKIESCCYPKQQDVSLYYNSCLWNMFLITFNIQIYLVVFGPQNHNLLKCLFIFFISKSVINLLTIVFLVLSAGFLNHSNSYTCYCYPITVILSFYDTWLISSFFNV